jgi:regulator of sigma E protease
MNILTNVLAFAFALGVIIIVHEAGHLLVAKAFGVRVLTFSVGFGKRIWGMRRGETEYRLSAIPLGGYVRLGGENPDENTGDPREFLNKPRWQRILVYLAGPLMNVLLAIGLFAILFMVGIELTNLPEMPPVVGEIEQGSSADTAGIRRGDRIVALNGDPMDNWQDVFMGLVSSPKKPVQLQVEREGRTFNATVTPRETRPYEGDLAGIFPILRAKVTQVFPGQPAEKAGLLADDELRALDGRPINDRQAFIDYIGQRAGKPVVVTVVRKNQEEPLTLTVVPEGEPGAGRIGIGIGSTGYYQRYGPARAVVASVQYNIVIVKATFDVLGKIFSRQIAPQSALAGPIEIAAQSGAAARTGFKELLHLMGFISISIAIMNLLPIPILDGGQICILAVEGVIRRDLSLRFKEVVSQVGFVMILLLMFMVLWFDLVKNVKLPDWLLPG